MIKQLLPAYPLFTKDPFFSIWSNNEYLNKSDTIFWTGLKRPIYGYIRANGKIYCFMGVDKRAITLQQTKLSVSAFSTDYAFECDLFELEVSFVSPVPPTDLEILSCPVCYFDYTVKPKTELLDVEIYLVLDESLCYNQKTNYLIGGSFNIENRYEVAFFGLNRQLPMSHTFDLVAADWGYMYVAAKKALFCTQDTVDKILEGKGLHYTYSVEKRAYLAGADSLGDISRTVKGSMQVAFDDLCSIFYFGEWLRGYFFRDGSTIFDAIEYSISKKEEIYLKLHEFENDLNSRLKDYDDDYRLIIYASLRQTMAAHKLVQNEKGEAIFISKECGSNGCAATVDITYPSMPLFLLYAPELLKGMMLPIFKFARLPVWPYDFAPHDAGTFPYCLGQTYGLMAYEEKTNSRLSNQFRRNRQNGEIVSHPMIYCYPKNSNIYRFDRQMPVEECANMLIISAAYLKRTGDRKFLIQNYDLLEKWYRYLLKIGLIPFKQLCTDDFTTTYDKHVNLAIKAIVGIKSFEIISREMGKEENQAETRKRCEDLSMQFKETFNGYDFLPISFGEKGTFSLKYNFAFDVLFETNIFGEDITEKEIDCYLANLNKYGVPLYSVERLTKSDWLMYVCALTSSKEKQRKIYSRVAKYLRETPDRLPFGDLYYVDDGTMREFRNRSVQGASFILLLKDAKLLSERPEGEKQG